MRSGSKGSSSSRGASGRGPSARMPRCISATSIGSPTSSGVPALRTSRTFWQRHAASKSRRWDGASACSASGFTGWRPLETKRARASIRFSVRVPVLSVQMTVAEPSVSTEVRSRTSALRRAMRCEAMASERVTVGSRPSGTLATMMPMAKRRFSHGSSPSPRPRRKKTTPSTVASPATIRPRRTISRCRGVSSSRGRLGEVGDAPELRLHAGGEDERARPPGGEEGARQQHVVAAQQLLLGDGRGLDGLRQRTRR